MAVAALGLPLTWLSPHVPALRGGLAIIVILGRCRVAAHARDVQRVRVAGLAQRRRS